MNKCMIMLLMGVVYSSTSHANLLKSLQNYCIPKDGAGCSSDVKATYNEGSGNCTCNSISKRYNSDDRTCEECITGSYASDNWKTCEPVKCPAGYKAVLVENGVCPTGYKLQTITNQNCPSGYGLKQYNPTTKNWS